MHDRSQYVVADRLDSAAMDDREGRSEVVFVLAAGAVSGAIMGFIFAGEIRVSAGLFVGILLGVASGWWARGVAAS